MSAAHFGRYEIIRELARGGMAKVYEARDPRMEREVAVKVLNRELSEDPTFQARFEREARTIASLEHPAIVPIYDFGEQDGQMFLVMRHMRGGSLAERIRGGGLPIDRLLNILERIAGALQHAHAQGVIHRDLKPGNVLFDLNGEAYLGDFGIAHLSGEVTTLTSTGTVIGTPAYMSPEQVYGDVELDGRSDVYSLGVILFEMLSGKQPYRADTPAKVMMQHVMEPIPRIHELDPDLAPDWEAVFQRALAKSREDRYPTPARLTQEVRSLAAQGQLPAGARPAVPGPTAVEPRPQSTTPAPGSTAATGEASTLPEKPTRRRVSLVVAGVAIVVLLAAATVGLLSLFGGLRGSELPATPGGRLPAAVEPTEEPTRPAATPLPAATPTLVPEFYGIRFCDRPCDSPAAVGITTAPEGTTTIYVGWSYRGMLPGTPYTRTWSVEGDEWLHYECEWKGPAEGSMETTLREPNGLRSGPWTVTLRIGGQPAVEATVQVEGSHRYWDPAGFLPCPDFPEGGG